MDSSEKSTPKFSKYAKYSSLVIQMGVIIAFFTWLGTYLDNKYGAKTPWWTIVLSLFGVGAGLYLVLRDVIKSSKEDDEK